MTGPVHCEGVFFVAGAVFGEATSCIACHASCPAQYLAHWRSCARRDVVSSSVQPALSTTFQSSAFFSFASTFNIPLFMLLAPRFTLCTLKLYIARPPRHTLSSASHFQPCLHTLHPALHIPNPTFPVLYLRILQSTPNLPHFPRNTPPSPFHTFHSTLYVPHVPLHIPHFAPRAHT